MDELTSLAPAAAEITLAIGICVVLLVDLWVTDRARDITYFLTLLTPGAVAWAAGSPGAEERVVLFSGSYVVDPLARLLKLFALMTMGAVFLYSRSYLRQRNLLKGEYYTLGLFVLLGIFVMISANSLLVMYLGLETLSLALYALVAFDRENPLAAESAMKYFVLGAIASGILLYGMSMLYGVTGTLRLDEISLVLQAGDVNQAVLYLAIVFIVVGIVFKFGGVPFHMWLPDVYQGAPTCVTLLIGTAPKIASVAMALRLLTEGLGSLGETWELLLIVVAVLSLLVGNIVAIAQTSVKRMLAYSTIGHVGFILLGLSAGNPEGLQGAVFYTLVYVLMAGGAFGVLIALTGRHADADQLSDLKGLSRRNPWLALMMLLLMASMIGIPPFLGFHAKLAVIAAMLQAGQVGLSVLAVLASVIGAFYYLRVIWYMYFEAAEIEGPVPGATDVRLLVSVNALAVLLLGLAPGLLLRLCAQALGA